MQTISSQCEQWAAIAPIGIELRVVTLLGRAERALHQRIVVEQGKENPGLTQTSNPWRLRGSRKLTPSCAWVNVPKSFATRNRRLHKAKSAPAYPSPAIGFTVNYTMGAAQRPTTIASTLNDSTHPGTLAQYLTYTPWGAVSSFQNGCVGSGCTQAEENYTYNNRLQPWMIQLGTSGNTSADYCLVYNYFSSSWTPPTSCPSPSSVPASGTGNNGNAMGYWYRDNVNPYSHTAAYTYDSVNRLTGACTLSGTQCATSGSNVYSLGFSYDRYGNMWCTGGDGGGSAIGPCPAWSYNANNRISTSGFSYDAAGNLLADGTGAGSHTFTWDAEGRMASLTPYGGTTQTMTYNALGERVFLNTNIPLTYLRDAAGNFLAGYSGGAWNAAVWLGGRQLAMYGWATGNPAYFTHANALDSSTMATDASGAAAGEILYYPWGQNWQDPGGFFGSTSYQEWASMVEFDPSLSGYLTPNREYGPTPGRWLSPDPSGGDVTNPQSLNRYAYVLNDPTSLTDPFGLCPPGFSGSGGVCSGPKDLPLAWFASTLWDPFELQLAVICPGNGENCVTGFDFNGANVANSLATLPLPNPSSVLMSLAPAMCPSKKTFAAAYDFASSNLAAALTIANQLTASAAEILGLSAVESAFGTSNIAANHNNYFGLTSGPAFGGSVGTYATTQNRIFGVYPSPGFLNSGLSFANSFHGQRAWNTWNDPQLFVDALTKPRHPFNGEPGRPARYMNMINLMSAIIPCL